ncbi:MAG TPA: hypothetical protein VNL14_06270 [Candidatus Acidoferrales bacterium]|nr:hypothetical protein [Candidatus Acidoferrales bacterium]
MEVSWEDLTQPGAYVDTETGDLYRIPKEALLPGGSPLIQRESKGRSRLVRITADPFIETHRARLLCAEHNIKPNFEVPEPVFRSAKR